MTVGTRSGSRAGREAARFVAALLVTLATAAAAPRSGSAAVPATDCERLAVADLRAICERGELRVVRYRGERPPFFTGAGDDRVGFEVDLGRDIAERLGVAYREDNTAESFDVVVDRVADGSADIGLSKLSATLERARRVRFTRPYLTVYQALLVNRLSAPAGEPFRTLNAPSFVIGALGGTAYVGYAEAALDRARVRPYDDFEEMMREVVAGEIDAALMDSARADTWRRGHQQQLIHVRSTIDKSRRDPLAIAVAWDHTHLLAWLDLYLEQIEADGTAERLYRKWFLASHKGGPR